MRKLILLLVFGLLIVPPITSAQDITIEVWHIQNAEPGPTLFASAIERYQADHPDITVNAIAMQNDPYKQRIRTALGAGDEPCIFMSWGGGPMLEYVNADVIIPLTPYFETNIPAYFEGDNYMDYFMPASFSNVSAPDGEVYGVPVENVGVAVIFYNRQIFEDLGLEVPTNMEELETVAQTLIDNSIAPFSLAGGPKWPSSMYYMYLVDRLAGPTAFAEAVARTGSMEAEPFVRAGEIIQTWVQNGWFVEGFNGLDYDTGQSRIPMYAGQAAMELMGTWEIGNFLSENPDFYENNLGFFPFPAIEDGEGDPSSVVGTVGDNYYHIASSCEYPSEAFDFLTYLLDEQSISERIAAGRIPPIVGISDQIEEPLLSSVVAMVEDAASVQLWYDQYLPTELGQVHLDAIQALFGLAITPEETAAQQEEGFAEFFGS